MTKDNLNQLVQLISGHVMNKLQEKGIDLNDKMAQPALSNNCTETIDNHLLKKEAVIGGIVTAGKLEGYYSATILKDSIITPAARDYIKDKGIKVKVVTDFENPSQAKESNPNTWHYWSSCSKIPNTVFENLPGVTFNVSTVQSESANIVAAVKGLNQAIHTGQAQGGILVVETSAKAVYLTSRFQNFRSVVGSCLKTVEEGVQQFGANVLILEYAVIGQTALRDMIKYFVTAGRPDVSDNLSKLEIPTI